MISHLFQRHRHNRSVRPTLHHWPVEFGRPQEDGAHGRGDSQDRRPAIAVFTISNTYAMRILNTFC